MMSMLDTRTAGTPPAARNAALPLVVVTTFFPNVSAPRRTLFVKNLVSAMRNQANVVTVLAPLPYAPPLNRVSRWKLLRTVPSDEGIDGIAVNHPRFIAIPGLTWLNGLTYAFTLFPQLAALKRQHGPFMIHAHCAYPDGVGVAICAKLLQLPYVVTAHGSDMNVYAERASLRPQMRWALRGAEGVIAVSAALRDKVAALTGVPALVSHIPCAGFDPSVFTCRTSVPKLAGEARSIVFVGNLQPIKGLPFLLQAWHRLRQSGHAKAQDRLVIVGDGSERAALQRHCAELQIANSVEFTGSIAPVEVARRMASAEMLCLPSLNEGTPNVVVEALASGVPVVASRVGGIPDLVKDGVNGALANPGDVDSLAAALAAVLDGVWPPQVIRSSVEHLTWHALAQRNLAFIASHSPLPR